MRMLLKVNNFVKKYQPLIQTIGIVLILAGVILTFIQISQVNKGLEFEQQGRSYEYSPGWRIEFKKNEDNALVDELSISSSNDSYNIQSIRLKVLDGIKLYEFENIGSRIPTASFKSRLSRIYEKYYNLASLDCRPCYEDDSYPIAITIYYERFGERHDTTILYDYHFRTYSTREVLRFKSQGLEFIKYIRADSATLTKELIVYNLTSSFLSNISNATFQIKLAIASKDSLLDPIIKYAYSNVRAYESSFVYVTDKTSETIGEFVLMMPILLYDSMATEDHIKIVKSLKKHINSYDDNIVSAIVRIQEYEKSFFSVKGQTHLDSLKKGGRIIGNKEQWNEWAEMNSELVNLAIKRIKI